MSPADRPTHRRPSPARSGAYGRPGRDGPRGAMRRGEGDDALWLFGIHAVRDALENPARRLKRLLLTPNAQQRIAASVEAAIARCGIEVETQDPRRFSAPIDPGSVHQGAALLTEPLAWGSLEELCALRDEADAPRVVLLDRVTDPHNVGAILRSAEVFGARAVIAPQRHSAPETGALAKTASGALERQPYLRVKNLGDAMESLRALGYVLIGFDGEAPISLDAALREAAEAPLALVLGAEGPGMREKTRELCDALVKIPAAQDFASLNVSNAAAVALYATRDPKLDA